MSTYVIFNYKITDRAQIEKLTQKSNPINVKYGAKVIVASLVKTIEGEALPNMVILEFKDFQSAKEWYHCEEHQEIILLRNTITEGWATIVPGVDEMKELIKADCFE